jgi:ATP-dependent RNA helicase DDX35
MAFWKPGTIAPGSDIDRETAVERDELDFISFNPLAGLSLQQQRVRLPVFKISKGIRI